MDVLLTVICRRDMSSVLRNCRELYPAPLDRPEQARGLPGCMGMRTILLAVLATLSVEPAVAQQRDSALDKAGDIASQPARDVGATERKIPAILQDAIDAPYKLDGVNTCPVLATNIAALNNELGNDLDEKQKKGGTVGKYAEAGGKFVVNTIIPFRGLVREVSGAAAADRRLEAAKQAGIARRGFLRGVQATRKCPEGD